MGRGTQFPTTLKPDPALAIDAKYRFNNADRQDIDTQILGVQQVVAALVASGAQVAQRSVDGGSAAISAGDVLLAASSATAPSVTRLTAALLAAGASVEGVAASAPVNGKVAIITAGFVPASITSLGSTGGAIRSKVAVNTSGASVARMYRVAVPDGSELIVGTCSKTGDLTMLPFAPVGAAPRHLINVKSAPYYAAGDGVTDDTAAFVAAFAAKDAAGGGEIFVPLGRYKLTSAIDVGTSAFILRGAGWRRNGLAFFGGAPLSTYTGTVLNFVNDTNGVTASTNSIQGWIKDLAIVGPGIGSTNAGLVLGAAGNFVSTRNLSIGNFYAGIQQGGQQSASNYDVEVIGNYVGLLSNGAGSSASFNVKWYNFRQQANAQATIISSATDQQFFGGLCQANTDGWTLRSEAFGTIREIHAHGVWFEGNGFLTPTSITNVANNGSGFYRITTSVPQGLRVGMAVTIAGTGTTADGVRTISAVIDSTHFDLTLAFGATASAGTVSSAVNTGRDIVFDSTTAAIANLSFSECRLTADAVPVTFVGANVFNYLGFYRCFFGTQAMTLGTTLSNGVFEDCGGLGTITNRQNARFSDRLADTTEHGTFAASVAITSTGPVTAGTYLACAAIPATLGDVRCGSGANTGLVARSNGNTYNVSLCNLDIFDDVIVGEPNHAASVQRNVMAGGVMYDSFGGVNRYVRNDKVGTLNTQLAALANQDFPAFVRTVNAAAASVAIGYNPSSGEGARITVRWRVRDASSGDCASGEVAATYRNKGAGSVVAGSVATVSAAVGDATLTTCAVTITGAAGALITATPPGAYSGNLDWSFQVYLERV